MTLTLVAADDDTADRERARAVEGRVRRNNALLKPHRGGDDLEGGAGLVGFADRFVLPHRVKKLVFLLLVFLKTM